MGFNRKYGALLVIVILLHYRWSRRQDDTPSLCCPSGCTHTCDQAVQDLGRPPDGVPRYVQGPTNTKFSFSQYDGRMFR